MNNQANAQSQDSRRKMRLLFEKDILRTIQRMGAEARRADFIRYASREAEVHRYASVMFDEHVADEAADHALHGDPIPREWIAARHRA